MMTSTVTQVTQSFLHSHTSDAVSTTVGVIAMLLLAVLLSEKELLRAYGGRRTSKGVAVLNIAIVPLLAVFAVVVIQRLADMLAGTH